MYKITKKLQFIQFKKKIKQALICFYPINIKTKQIHKQREKKKKNKNKKHIDF